MPLPFVERVWAARSAASPAPIERVLPTGQFHIVVRLSGPLTLFDDRGARTLGCSVIGGARSASYVRSVAEPSDSVGALLAPGVAPLIFGMPATELAEAHTSLEDLWGREARVLRERLAEATTPRARMAILESTLREKVTRSIDPVVVDAVTRFRAGARVQEVVDKSGYSHRAFIARFRDAVGLTPKTYCRIVRSQRAVALMRGGRALVEVALDAGYADQAHFAREFREITGLAPSRYRALSPAAENHVPSP